MTAKTPGAAGTELLAFSFSLLGTFLVRSGVLTSVHAFAVDPQRGAFILMILCVFIGGSLSLFAWRAPQLKAGGLFAPVSREGSLVLNNLLLCVACLAVFVGTLYPLALEALTAEKISVGAPYFNLTFGSLMVPLLRGEGQEPLGVLVFLALCVIWATLVGQGLTLRAGIDNATNLRLAAKSPLFAYEELPRSLRVGLEGRW